MEANLLKKTQLRILFIGLSLSFIQGCASTSKSVSKTQGSSGKSTQSVSPIGPEEAFGPPEPAPEPSYGPEPVRSQKIVLVLGPGLARGFAYAGALRALEEAKIPIAAILGTEMGGLVGALYCFKTINRFEWALLKFKEDVFLDRGGFLSSFNKESTKNGEKLNHLLEEIFSSADLSKSKIPFKIAVQKKSDQSLLVLETGSVAQAVRGTMSDPGLFTPAFWEGIEVISAARSYPFLVAVARSLGLGPVITLNALPDNETSNLDELKQSDLVIQPNLTGIGPLDFDKRTDAAFQGKKAIQDHLPEIKRLIGLDKEPSENRSNHQ